MKCYRRIALLLIVGTLVLGAARVGSQSVLQARL